MFNVVLLYPEIAPNTDNVIRLAANAGVRLHLVRPLGFALDDRAGVLQLEREGRVHDVLRGGTEMQATIGAFW